MKFEMEVQPLPIDSLERIVRSSHHPIFANYEHSYVCSQCREIWPCTIVKVAATALHYANECQEWEEKNERQFDWDE